MWIRSSNRSRPGTDEYGSALSPYVICVCFIAATGGFMFGYDVGVSGGVTVMDDFLCEFFPRVLKHKIEANASRYEHRLCSKINGSAVRNPRSNHTGEVYCRYDNQVVQLFTSSLYLTAMVVTFAAGVVTWRHGRRASMLLGAAFFALGSAINAAAIDRGMLIFGRIMLGCGVGFGNQVVPLFLSEIAPTGSRGGVNNLFQLFVTFGILIANMVNLGAEHVHPWGWRLSLAVPLIPASALMVGSLLIVDTPNSLVERGQYLQARQAIIKLRARSGAPCDDNYINGVIEDLKSASISNLHNSNVDSMSSTAAAAPAADDSCNTCSSTNYFGSLLERRNRPPLLISIFVQLFQQFTGINVIMMYAPVFFSSVGGPFLTAQRAALYSAIIIGAINVLSTLIAIFLVDRVGRRALLLQASVQMCVAQVPIVAMHIIFSMAELVTIREVLIAIVLAKSSVEHGKLHKLSAIVILLFICVFVSAFAWSWGPLAWLISTEIFPLITRSQGQSVTVCSNMLFTFIIAQTTLTSLCHLKYGLFIFFGACTMLSGVLTYFFLPETMDIDIELMPIIWVRHWFWKRYFTPCSQDKPSQYPQKTPEISLNTMAMSEPSNPTAIFPTSYLPSPI